MSVGLRALSLAGLSAVVACGTHFTALQTTGASQLVAPESTLTYAIPIEAPKGHVEVASYGVVEVSIADTTTDERLRALHLRIIVTNVADRIWTLDTREQRLALEGRGLSAPAFASADPGSPPPQITVPMGGRRVVDFFFPLPADLALADPLPPFDALWRVSTEAKEAVVDRTIFQSLLMEPSKFPLGADYGNDYYWGPPYWHNPLYARASFRGTDIVPRDFAGHPLIIRRRAAQVAFRSPPRR
jgi:hypothetical protein